MLSQAAVKDGPRPPAGKASTMWDKLTRPKFKQVSKRVVKEAEPRDGEAGADEKMPGYLQEQLKVMQAELQHLRMKGDILCDCLKAAGLLTDANMEAGARRYNGCIAMEMF